MNKKALLITLAAALLLSGCRVEGIHTMGTVSTDSLQTSAEDEAAITAEQTADEDVEVTTDFAQTASEDDDNTDEASPVTTNPSVTEAADAETEPSVTPTLPPATEAEEETEEAEEIEEEIIFDTEIGLTYDGEEFEIDSDFAYFIVNKENFLPEDYSIETDTVQGDYVMEKTAAYFCRMMIAAAKEDGIDLKIISAYRTVKYQERLFERNVESRMESGMTYEEAYADTSVNIAPPGGSEHNAGLAVDIVTKKDWDTYTGFEDTEEFAWLQEHAHEYGFFMRYLKGKEDITGYIYEPWHYRYVGVKYAKALQESGLCMEEYFELHGLD